MSSKVLVGNDLNFGLLLVVREHNSDAVTEGQVLPRDVNPVTTLGGPDFVDTRPDFLTALVFARCLTMVSEVWVPIACFPVASLTLFPLSALALSP